MTDFADGTICLMDLWGWKFWIRTFAAECVSSYNKYVMVDIHQCTLKILYSASRGNFNYGRK